MNTEVQIPQYLVDTPVFITEENLIDRMNKMKDAMDNIERPIRQSLFSDNNIDELIELFCLGIISKDQARNQLKGESVCVSMVIKLVKSGLMDNQEARKLLLK